VYHFPIVYVNQPLGNFLELSGTGHEHRSLVVAEAKPYQFEPIHILITLDKLVDIPIFNPLRCNRIQGIANRYSQ
jgi:hypothetical protein